MATSFATALQSLGEDLDALRSLTDVDRSRLLLQVTTAVRHIADEAKALDAARAEESAKAATEADEATAMARRTVANEAILSAVERRIAALLFQHGDLREQFVSFDLSGDGRVSVDEFRYALSRLGVRLTDEEALAVVRAYDTNGDGKIDYDELVRFVSESDWRPGDLGDPRSLSGRSTAPLPEPKEDVDAATRRTRAIALLRSRIESKFGTAREAWLTLHPHGDASGRMSVKALAARLRTYTGLVVSATALKALLQTTGKSVDFATFNTLVSRKAPSSDEFYFGGREESGSGGGGGGGGGGEGKKVGPRGRGLSRTVRAVAKASAERRSSSTGRGRPAKEKSRPSRALAKVLEQVQFGLEQTSHSAKDLHERMRRHSELGVDEDDIVWGFKRYLKTPVSPKEARAIIAAFDADHDGQLSFGEFLGLLRAAAEAGGAM